MPWQFNRTEAVFVQIARRLRREILGGKYPKGEQFPPVRQLAAQAAVNPNTVQKALALLEQEGLLCAHGTAGRFVSTSEEVLTLARERICNEIIRDLLKEMNALGVTKAELLKYIEEEHNYDGSPHSDVQESDEKL